MAEKTTVEECTLEVSWNWVYDRVSKNLNTSLIHILLYTWYLPIYILQYGDASIILLCTRPFESCTIVQMYIAVQRKLRE